MKIVITGGPCSGKTTIINELKKRGYFTMEETARKIIIENIYSKNLNIENEALNFELNVYQKQIEKEKDLDKADDVYPHIVFLDRGCIDVRAYCQHLIGHIPKEIMNVKVKRYDAVIVLDRLPLIDDGLRRKTKEDAEIIHQQILQEYVNAGYTPIIIPIMSIKERLKNILEIINKIEHQTGYGLIIEKNPIEIV